MPEFTWKDKEAGINQAITLIKIGSALESALRASIYAFGENIEKIGMQEITSFRTEVLARLQ